MASNENTINIRQPHIAAGYAQERNESLYPQLWDELVCFHSNLGGPASELVPNLGGSTRETHPYGTQVGGIGDPYIDPLVGPAWDNDDTANRYVDTGIDLACANRSFSHFSRARRDTEPWGGVQSVGGACWNGGTSKQWGLTIASGPAIRLAFYSSGNNHHDWNTFGTLSSWESILATYDDPTRVSMLYNKTLSDPHTHSGDMSYTGTLRYYLGQYAGGFEHTGHLSANGFWFRVLDSTEWEILRDDPVAPFRRKVRNYWFVPTGGGDVVVSGVVLDLNVSMPEPAVVQGSITIAGQVCDLGLAVPDPGVILGSVTVGGQVCALASSIVDPGVTLGSITISGEIATLGLDVLDPAIIPISGIVMDMGLVIPDPSIVIGGGDIIVSGVVLDMGLSAPDPAVQLGSVTVSGEAASLSVAIPDPSVIVGGNVTISGIVLDMGLSVVYSTVDVNDLIAFTVKVPAVQRVFLISETGSMQPDHTTKDPNDELWYRFDFGEFLDKDQVTPSDSLVSGVISLANPIEFSGGSGTAPKVGDTFSASPSGATGALSEYRVTSGSWADGDAAGVMLIEIVTGDVAAGDTLSLPTTTVDVDFVATKISEAAKTVGATTVDVKITGGQHEYDHTVTCRATTVGGQVKDQTLTLEVRHD